MHQVTPKIFVIAETNILSGIRDMLEHLGVPGWSTGCCNESEGLVEIMGRLCYRSFDMEHNKNLTHIREGNKEYIANILQQKHFSVLEHAQTTVALLDVSRVLTHELVRHRHASPSQESGRFVRIDDIGMYIPDLTKDFDAAFKAVGSSDNPEEWQTEFRETVERITTLTENAIKYFSTMLDLPGIPFRIKKKITSALRRLAPTGQSTNIGISANHSAWRGMIEKRTSSAAEVEIRLVFGMIARDFKVRYPAFYQDMEEGLHDGIPFYTFVAPL